MSAEIQDVDQSTRQYIWKHYWLHLAIILTVAVVLAYILSYDIMMIGFITLIILTMFWNFSEYQMRSRFMKEFGRIIGYRYRSKGNLDSVQGAIFGIGRSQAMSNVLSGTHENTPTRLFNYSLTVGSGKSSHSYHYTMVEVTLVNQLPEILLYSRRNDVPLLIDGPTKKITLEGDFNKYFSLFVTENYEREVYEVFTPDVMATLIDKASDLNCEFSGHKLYIYKSGYIKTRQEIQHFFNLADYLISIFQKSTSGINVP